MEAKKMKPITALVVLCALIVPISSVAAEGPPRQGTGGGVLRVAAEPDTPPMLTREGNRYDGFDWAIANAVAKRIGFNRVEIVAGKYSELPGRLIAGQADVI